MSAINFHGPAPIPTPTPPVPAPAPAPADDEIARFTEAQMRDLLGTEDLSHIGVSPSEMYRQNDVFYSELGRLVPGLMTPVQLENVIDNFIDEHGENFKWESFFEVNGIDESSIEERM